MKKEYKNNKQKGVEKNEGNNQWTNNNLKYYPDDRERRNGPGGEYATNNRQ